MNDQTEPPFSKGKILVVDDEKCVCHILTDHLQERNYEIVCAYDGEEALQKVKEEDPRFVLLDYAMPKMSGLEVLEELKKIDPEIVVIMMTGLDEEWIWDRARSIGVDGFLIKPIDFKYLETLLATKLI